MFLDDNGQGLDIYILLIDRESSRRRVAALCLPALIGRCRTTLAGYVADEKIRGNLPFPRYMTPDVNRFQL
jgi:hypothetical protein